MKKALKIIGNIVMIAALAFVVKKLLDMDISFSQLSEGRVVCALLLCFAVSRIIAFTEITAFICKLHNFVADFIQKVSVMRNNNNRALIAFKVILQPFHPAYIKMVCGLVKQN